MITQLAKIVAPAITDPTYMSGINNAFDIINENFKKLASLPFVQGVQGDSYTTVIKNIWDTNTKKITGDGAILLNSIFNLLDDNEIEKGDSFNTVKFKIGNTLNSTSPIDFFLDENKNIVHNELYFYAVIDDTGNEEQKQLGQYYYFVDGRLKEIGNAYYNEKIAGTFTDYTGFYRYIPKNDIEEEHYEKIDILPTLYYDSDRNDICWKFNGVNTGISAVGVSGKDGKSKPIKFVMLEYIDTTNGVQNQSAYTLKIEAVFDSNSQVGWIYKGSAEFNNLCADIDKGDTVIAQYTFRESQNPGDAPGVAFSFGVVTNKTNTSDIDVTYSANSIITSDIADTLINDYLQNITSTPPRTTIRNFLGIDRNISGVITKIKPNNGDITIVRENEEGSTKEKNKTLILDGYMLNCINSNAASTQYNIALQPSNVNPIEFTRGNDKVFYIRTDGSINTVGSASINDGRCQIISSPETYDEFINLKTSNSNAVSRLKHHVTQYDEAVTTLCSDAEGETARQYLDLYTGPTGSAGTVSPPDDKTTTYFGEARTGIRIYHHGKKGENSSYGIQTRGPVELLSNGSYKDATSHTRLIVNGFTKIICPAGGINNGKALDVKGQIKVSQNSVNGSALDITGDVSFSDYSSKHPQIKGKYFPNFSYIYFSETTKTDWNAHSCTNIAGFLNTTVYTPKYCSPFILLGNGSGFQFAFSSDVYQRDSVVFITNTSGETGTIRTSVCTTGTGNIVSIVTLVVNLTYAIYLGSKTFNIQTTSGGTVECIEVLRVTPFIAF